MNLEIRFAPGRLRQARRAAGLSQEGLARAVDVTTGVIQNAESGRHVPSAETVAAIASTFCGVTATVELVGPAEVVDPDSVFFPQPDRVRADATPRAIATVAAPRHRRCPLSRPVNTPTLSSPDRPRCLRAPGKATSPPSRVMPSGSG